MKIYWKMLSPIFDAEFERRVEEHIRYGKRFPYISDLLQNEDRTIEGEYRVRL